MNMWNDGTELYHYGIPGQKWGIRNGPPYPLGQSQKSYREKNRSYRDESYEKRTAKRSGGGSNKKYYDELNVSSEKRSKIERALKVLGIVAGTAAAGVLIGYACNGLNLTDINSDHFHIRPFKLNNSLFNNRRNGDYIGSKSIKLGYARPSIDDMSNDILHPISVLNTTERWGTKWHAGDESDALDYLAKKVRCEQISTGANRPLSCWSAANAYYLSALTGRDYASLSFDNLVDFNDFGKLYNRQPNIYGIAGSRKSDFVGKFDSLIRKRCTDTDCLNLVTSIMNCTGLNDNSTVDGRTIGFINGGYATCKCWHQFNYEILSEGANKLLMIVDGYSGSRYPVASVDSSGGVKTLSKFADFCEEMRHYNKDSVRFYAPDPNTLNLEILSKAVLRHFN